MKYAVLVATAHCALAASLLSPSLRHAAIDAPLDLDNGGATLVDVDKSEFVGGDSGPRTGVINFLFLVGSIISHEDIWQSYFSKAHPGSFRIFVHCGEEEQGPCYGDAFAALPEVSQVPTVPTAYCDDLVTAMARLLESALLSPAPPGVTEKFVFVSDTTLPVKPFAYAHRALSEDAEASDICVHPSANWGSAVVDGVQVHLVKTSQWVTLSRTHAKAFVAAWQQPVDADEVKERGFANSLSVPLPGVTWDGQARSMVAGDFDRDFKVGICTDEWAWFAKLFGAFKPGQAGERFFPGFGTLRADSAAAQGRCDTFVFQGKQRNWQGNLALPVIAAAEADPDESQGRDGVNDRGNFGFNSRGSHPISFLTLGDVTLKALRDSPFLFARRFPDGSLLPHFEELVLNT